MMLLKHVELVQNIQIWNFKKYKLTNDINS